MIGFSKLKNGLSSLQTCVQSYGTTRGCRRWSSIVYYHFMSDISGKSIFESDWDICVIVDACRADELERFIGEYRWLSDVGRYPSLASCTWDWVPETVEATRAETLQETTYISANPFVKELTAEETFGELDAVYEYAWNADIGTVRPEAVTDSAIGTWQKDRPDRMVVHYIQPHVPFLTEEAESISRNNFDHDERSDFDAWDRVTAGELDREVAIERYRVTLKQVLDSIDTFLSSVDADNVVITADHGEAFGEMGIYGHPSQIDLPCLVSVPWVETTASKDQDYEVHDERTVDKTHSTEDQLQALGYSK